MSCSAFLRLLGEGASADFFQRLVLSRIEQVSGGQNHTIPEGLRARIRVQGWGLGARVWRRRSRVWNWVTSFCRG